MLANKELSYNNVFLVVVDSWGLIIVLTPTQIIVNENMMSDSLIQ
jgi:hypothetical protein